MTTKTKPVWLTEEPEHPTETARLLVCRDEDGDPDPENGEVARLEPWHSPTNFYGRGSRVDGWVGYVGNVRVLGRHKVFDSHKEAKASTLRVLGWELDGITCGLRALTEACEREER